MLSVLPVKMVPVFETLLKVGWVKRFRNKSIQSERGVV